MPLLCIPAIQATLRIQVWRRYYPHFINWMSRLLSRYLSLANGMLTQNSEKPPLPDALQLMDSISCISDDESFIVRLIKRVLNRYWLQINIKFNEVLEFSKSARSLTREITKEVRQTQLCTFSREYFSKRTIADGKFWVHSFWVKSRSRVSNSFCIKSQIWEHLKNQKFKTQ